VLVRSFTSSRVCPPSVALAQELLLDRPFVDLQNMPSPSSCFTAIIFSPYLSVPWDSHQRSPFRITYSMSHIKDTGTCFLSVIHIHNNLYNVSSSLHMCYYEMFFIHFFHCYLEIPCVFPSDFYTLLESWPRYRWVSLHFTLLGT
jgi:hypothetical protein